VIGSLRGTLLRKEASQVLIEAGGVGYLVQVPFSTSFRLGGEGDEARLLVHTHVRDDAIQLYGFATDLELAVFARLIDVNGIGPKMAVNILSGIPAAELVAAIRNGDVRRLGAVPGVGKKTSERLVLELRDKFELLVVPAPPSPGPARLEPLREDAVSALVNLGYRVKEAEAAVDRVPTSAADTLEGILRAALTRLVR
jgi:Holliday junction DNA helicase RuvA